MHAPAHAPIPTDLLLTAYRNGIFPMADSRDDPELFWVEPRERAIIPLNGFRCSRSLAKVLRREPDATLPEAYSSLLSAAAGGSSSPGKLIAQSLTQTS